MSVHFSMKRKIAEQKKKLRRQKSFTRKFCILLERTEGREQLHKSRHKSEQMGGRNAETKGELKVVSGIKNFSICFASEFKYETFKTKTQTKLRTFECNQRETFSTFSTRTCFFFRIILPLVLFSFLASDASFRFILQISSVR